MIDVRAREKRIPLWAAATPVFYLLACVLAVRASVIDHQGASLAGFLVAIGLFPAFVIPAIFTTSNVRLAAMPDGLAIDGRLEKIDEIRLARGEKGSGVVHVTMRNGRARAFVIASYKDGQLLMSKLPPISAPTGALLV